jgi:hypothetical protein
MGVGVGVGVLVGVGDGLGVTVAVGVAGGPAGVSVAGNGVADGETAATGLFGEALSWQAAKRNAGSRQLNNSW